MGEEIKILDLDSILPEERQIKVNGKTYRIRGDASVEETLKLAKYSGNNTSPEAIDALFNAVQSFFIDKIELSELKTLGVKTQLPALISFLYGGLAAEKKTLRQE
jgi:hypothetical protein